MLQVCLWLLKAKGCRHKIKACRRRHGKAGENPANETTYNIQDTIAHGVPAQYILVTHCIAFMADRRKSVTVRYFFRFVGDTRVWHLVRGSFLNLQWRLQMSQVAASSLRCDSRVQTLVAVLDLYCAWMTCLPETGSCHS